MKAIATDAMPAGEIERNRIEPGDIAYRAVECRIENSIDRNSREALAQRLKHLQRPAVVQRRPFGQLGDLALHLVCDLRWLVVQRTAMYNAYTGAFDALQQGLRRVFSPREPLQNGSRRLAKIAGGDWLRASDLLAAIYGKFRISADTFADYLYNFLPVCGGLLRRMAADDPGLQRIASRIENEDLHAPSLSRRSRPRCYALAWV